MQRLLPITDDSLNEAADLLKRGGLVGMPTETVYGLAGIATDPAAVAAIFAAKRRPHFNPLIAHLASPDWLSDWTSHLPDLAESLVDRFWPGPLTLVLPKTAAIPDLVTAGLPTVGLRCPDHPVAQQLIAKVGLPLAAPSANRYMHISPTEASHLADLGDAVSLILDAGPCQRGLESTVIGFSSEDRPILYRLGALAMSDLESVTGPLLRASEIDADGNAESAKHAPGMVARHYAPHTPLQLITADQLVTLTDPDAALLAFARADVPASHSFCAVEVLSERGDPREAAARLFAAMRRLDRARASRILATPAPDEDLGPAINDRLRRAATLG